MIVRIPPALLNALVEHGLCPSDASKLTIEFPANAVAVLKYEVFIGVEHLPKLAAAFSQMDAAWRVKEGQRLADEIARRTAPDGNTTAGDVDDVGEEQ